MEPRYRWLIDNTDKNGLWMDTLEEARKDFHKTHSEESNQKPWTFWEYCKQMWVIRKHCSFEGMKGYHHFKWEITAEDDYDDFLIGTEYFTSELESCIEHLLQSTREGKALKRPGSRGSFAQYLHGIIPYFPNEKGIPWRIGDYAAAAAAADDNDDDVMMIQMELCPVIVLSPGILGPDFGKKAEFSAFVEAKLDPPLDAKWQRIKNGDAEDIKIYDKKYFETQLLPSPKLVINTVDFDDVGYFQLQVKISGGWCVSSTVHIEKVWGILQYNNACNATRECDERMYLQCSNNMCLCSNSYYHRNETCFYKSNLQATNLVHNITESNINVGWNEPSVDSKLIQCYSVTIKEYSGSVKVNASVGKHTDYMYKSDFLPGHRYVYTITSTVQLTNPLETIYVQTSRDVVVEPLSPGLIDKNNSNFHPEKLYLRWDLPGNETRVDRYQVSIDGNTRHSSSNYISWPIRLEPGRVYPVTIITESWYWYSFGRNSQPYKENIETLRTPKVIIANGSSITIPFLSNLVIMASVQNNTEFPATLETKWQKDGVDINITESRYMGSSLDLFNPKLVINVVDFDHEHNNWYRCIARNAEGVGTSTYGTWVYVRGSLNFSDTCKETQECLPSRYFTCRNTKCFCQSSHYHKNGVCYDRDYLKARVIDVQSSTCDITIKWKPPYQDKHLLSGYEVVLSETVSVGNATEYKTPCTFQPGLLYFVKIRSNILLSDPKENISVHTSGYDTILEPLKPGPILRDLSNFSADNLYLRWEKSGKNSFVNRYKVKIGKREQMTKGNVPEIYWKELLLPVTLYNVTITAISYGFLTNYPSYGSRESLPSLYWIETGESQYTGKAYMSYGDGDYILSGDDVISGPLRSPTTVFVGDGSEEGFNTVYIGSNGIIGLGERFNNIVVHEMDSKKVKEKQIICPFWTDLLSVNETGKVYYNTYRRGIQGDNIDSMFMEKADGIVKKHFRDLRNFRASWLVKVTWENMTLYGDKTKKVTFQCFLITDGENTFTVINYVDVDLKPIGNRKVSIGYRYKKFFAKNSFTNRKGAFRMSVNPGNRGERGFWIYKMTESVHSKREEQECFVWYDNNVVSQIRQKLSLTLNNIECPCDPRLLKFDPRYTINRFDSSNRMLCYASLTLDMNLECCYNMYADTKHLGPLDQSKPLAGTVLQYNPFFETYKYNNFDLKPRNQCCKSGHCNWYYEVRPIPRCYLRSPFQPGINFGDPHITTLDGKDYTFNGYGEYTMMKINTSTNTFDLQARTELATSENGTSINATIFSAFVARDHTGSKIQVEMSRDKKDMIIRGNGMDLTTKLRNSSYVFRTPNISILMENRTLSATFLKPFITIKISLGKRFLICETLVNDKHKGLTIGLMGNFDGNKTNDFILPNGTVLKEDDMNTERNIYYRFGQLWSVNEQSLFQYEDGFTYKNFTHPEFVPLFTDEVDENRLKEAKQKCGSDPSQACISDYLATGDIGLAETSGKKDKNSKSDVEVIENETPQISGNTTINVEVDKEVELTFNASDDGKMKPTYKLLKQPDNFSFDDETGIARWIPLINVSEISIIAVDDMGAQSPSLDISIILCSGCGDHGVCNYDNAIATENDRFYRAVCSCHIGYSGENCEKDTDACLEFPCPLDRNCTDLTPEEEVRLGREYNCTECPSGYKDNDNKCQDVDECASAELNKCDETKETCLNRDGDYICNCKNGYRKQDKECEDIDECLEGQSGCDHICTNTPGSFRCTCYMGFTLNKDNSTCNKIDDEICKSSEMQCEYACSNIDGISQCICPAGYRLTSNDKNCTDIDECALKTSPCEQDCVNINGSFKCACRPGFKLRADKTSCSRCELPYYGVNCSQECNCGPGVDRCDPGLGCICKDGWTGKNCSVDIDECHQDPTICGINKLCKNIEGSFKCLCEHGLQVFEDNCKDIDECLDALLNDCPQDTTDCSNTFGNYTCECKKGFQKKNNVCEDIDECSTSLHGCSQVCVNVLGGYNCACFYGFTLKEDRMTCEIEKDSCTSFPELNCTYGCKRDAVDKTKGICFCESGYELDKDNRTCIDINECNEVSVCDHNCTNKEGSFNCSCTVGYRLENDGRSCKACDQYHYGENCDKLCRCGRGARVCDNVHGCVCKPGWTGDTCDVDINECENSPCTGPHERCVNAPGSYRCDCIKGFKNYSGVCEDIDECQEPFLCHHKCENTQGTYRCSCKKGYQLINERDCEDINECNSANCGSCLNFPGGFECSCHEGYRLNATTKRECYNIDECMEGNHNCSMNAICTDTDGSFKCSCLRGFEGNGYVCTGCQNFTFGVQCFDKCSCVPNKTDECDAIDGKCRCKKGWTGSDCSEDVDECQGKNQICSTELYQTCVNTPGSFHCECRFGGQNLSDCIQPKRPQKINKTEVKVKAEVKFDINKTREDFLKNSQDWLNKIQTSLEEFYRKEKIHGFTAVVVLSIRFGSLIVDHEVIGVVTETNDLEKGVSNTMINLLTGNRKMNILGQETGIKEITIKHENGTSKATITTLIATSPCVLLNILNACNSGERCDDLAGEATCIKEKSDLSGISTYIVILGVSIPLFITVIVLTFICVRYQKKTEKKEIQNDAYRSNRMDVLKGNDEHIKPSRDYDSINSRSKYQNEYQELDFSRDTTEGCSNPNYTLDSIYVKLQPDEQFHIRRPNVKYSATNQY
ncbi:uncharacterized protein LOC134263292 [Saccostrea cucullata]|uniref:uncharacterized protein LOC134263292 n=1 Tax=Saccostrea cuccullata TaxID=36930 RepID=UPI002ED6A590